MLRATGPWGPSLVGRFRPDLVKKFQVMGPEANPSDYIFHINAQKPSGEHGFHVLTQNHAWARDPLIERLTDLPTSVPLTFIYGEHTWMDKNSGYFLKTQLKNHKTMYTIVPNAGHHVYVDNAQVFNRVVHEAITGDLLTESRSLDQMHGLDLLKAYYDGVRPL